jgi:oligosaccharide 4-alpha-D-glucosyltransferase
VKSEAIIASLFLCSLPDKSIAMKRICAAIFFLLIAASLVAQKTSLQYNWSDGKFTVQQYAANIFKLAYTPKDYNTNENVSDAVLLKPQLLNALPAAIKMDGEQIIIGNNHKLYLSGTFHEDENYRGFKFSLQPGEMMFGGGERALPLNRRGQRFNLYNNPWYGYSFPADNLNYSVPFFMSSHGYGLFFDNASKGYADIGKENEDILRVGFKSGELNVYVILGNDYKTMLTSFHKLTGTQPLPPRWALGNFMSRFGYTSQEQVNTIAAAMKAENMPVDAVIFDLFWFGDSIKQTMGNLDWVNKTKWPNPKQMISDFRKDNINTILITEPFVVEASTNYQASKQFHAVDSANNPFVLTDFYFGRGGLIDIFRKDAKDWFWTKHKGQMDIGVEAWWGDLGEPEKHPATMKHNLKDLGFKRLFSADEIHNVYGHYWTKMLYDKYAVQYPNKRLFSLNRSGFAGTQRYSIFPWTGDVSRSWKGLQAQLPTLLGMSMSGVPYVHSDAGGFAGGDGDNELYVRWLQFAAFTPIFRPHGTALYEIEKAAFSFPSEAALIDEPYRGVARNIIHQRYKMLAYNYTLSYKQATKGEPLMAPLYYHFPNDEFVTKVEDAYMWGENILVAPVVEKGATNRIIYLPEGEWYELTGNQMYPGKTKQQVDVSDFKLPLFVKAGGFVPQYKEVALSTTAMNKANFSLLYVPSSKPSTFEMYEDDGVSKNAIAAKQFELLQFSSTGKSSNGCTIQIKSNGGKYKGQPTVRKIQLVMPNVEARPKSITINGKSIKIPSDNEIGMVNVAESVIWLADKSNILTVPLTFTGTPLKVDIKW